MTTFLERVAAYCVFVLCFGLGKKVMEFWFQVLLLLFYKVVLTTSAVTSTILGLILIFAGCVIHRSPVLKFFHESNPNR